MGKKLIDITGNKYNMLTVIGFSHMVKNRSFWICQCDCGNIVTLQRSALVNTHLPSRNISCGCVKKALDKKWGEMHKANVDEIIREIQGENNDKRRSS